MLGAIVVGYVGYRSWSTRGVEGTGTLRTRLENYGTVAVLGGTDLLRLTAPGARLVPSAEIPGLDEALDGTDESVLLERLIEQGVEGLLIDGRAARGLAEGELPEDSWPLRDRLARYDSFGGLGAEYLAPAAALYVPRPGLRLARFDELALAHVAREVLGGSRSPSLSSFSEPLRRIRNVEVLVMLESNGHARLWRSARGSSIGRALLTAAVVARERWNERQRAMGGPLDTQLASLDVSVYLLDEDGTLGSRAPAFIERVFLPEHGVAYDLLGSWKYLLPQATRERGEGSAARAYLALFEDGDMLPTSIDREDVRLYRLLARELARSGASISALGGSPGVLRDSTGAAESAGFEHLGVDLPGLDRAGTDRGGFERLDLPAHGTGPSSFAEPTPELR